MFSRPLTLSAAALTAAALIVPVSQTAVAATPAGSIATPARSAKTIKKMSVAELRALTPRTRRAVMESRVDRSGGYQGQRGCRPGARPGTKAMKRLLKSTYSNRIPIGLSRRCGGDTSEHYDGRALDWMVNAKKPREAAMGDAYVEWLTKRRQGVTGAMARRLGVMYIIWRGRMWRAYDPGWRDYNGCSRRGGDPTSCHRNHVHISLTWAGARKQTSWYRAR